jgi:hypothetical protein
MMWRRVFAVVGLVIGAGLVSLLGLVGWLRRDKKVVS